MLFNFVCTSYLLFMMQQRIKCAYKYFYKINPQNFIRKLTEIYKCNVLRIYKKKLPWLYIRNTYCVLIIAKFYDMHGDVLNFISHLSFSSFYKYFQNPVYNICSICGVFHLLPLLLLFNQSG